SEMSENAPEDSADCNGVQQTEQFEIPELPCGRTLRFTLLSTWDDPHFIGLNTIEIFTADGQRPQVEEMKTNAKESLGMLESLICECGRWPCTDPQRMWTAKCDGMTEPVYLDIILKQEESIAMIRVWNYDQSRVHALRGVRDLRIDLDERTIFQGEISCAFTSVSEVHPMGDTILFTTDEAILERIAENDVCLADEEITASSLDLLSIDADTRASTSPSTTSLTSAVVHRPSTGDRKKLRSASRNGPEERSTSANVEMPIERPAITPVIDVEPEANELPSVKVLHMELTENWGAPDCIGLTSLQFLGPKGEILAANGCQITTSATSEISQRLLNGRNLTRNRDDMWLIPYVANGPPPRITITFPEPLPLLGICVWNYNASPEMSYAGVRSALLYVNGRPIVGPILLRKAPGYVYFDFVQDVPFNKCTRFRPLSRPNTCSINGFIYQLQLLSTWGDEFYIGLNGIEFFDHHDEPIKLQPQNLAAFPESVNILPAVKGDPRTSENLIDGVNDTTSASHMWLTPVLPNRYARVFVIFDFPTYVSQIRVYNYRKTPERGVRHIAVSVDDLIVFSGEVPPSSQEKTAFLAVSLRE
uniref:KATNIP domain-containing protein n=2 Tax=Parascaris univalens TaxID=6257 RepID=A0A915C316_PARUN